ncbi:NADH-quinone oxidoreductase subunit NuoN [Sulfuracidifex metallicus DSM 6482 = JCM 9184]|uniref:NADH-quinone oxidoreductase subunit NuoN n=1 Tax=Sulfuracidifex metallicus DSM 6482 = JCM 9184 TaxID=523847 RepID=A0A6A9QM64_SULME|nr:NADH-quinone oxidoreductase subunit NuoN [Sulfuracidifex metallicus DSM 6482 = JCM 9184]WOE51913.1 NADH-quinone oxidoreductase subunit NuoN [Sulfuracidifex metallicus DSM 6482 = JCM 9184]
MSFVDYLPLIIPSILLVFSSIAVLYIDDGRKDRFSISFNLAIITMIVTLAAEVVFWAKGIYGFYLFSKNVYIDVEAYLFSIAALLGGIIGLLGGYDNIMNWKARASLISLTMLLVLGIIYMSFSFSVIMILVSWAVSSAATYVIAMARKDFRSTKAGIKYLVMGLISSSLMIMGFALYVASTGSLVFTQQVLYEPLFLLSVALLSVSFLFKIGSFPFQGWLPDVYSMSDRTSISIISSVGKLIGIVPLFKVLVYSDPNKYELVIYIALAIASLFVGNFIAFSRQDVSSILAFSSVSQMGFFLVAFAMLFSDLNVAIVAILIQSIAYVVAQAGLFHFVDHFERISGTADLSGLRGMARSDKWLAFGATILVLSLLGIPPIVGFWGKLFVFESSFAYPWLTIIAVINSAISAGYYIPIMREMFRDGEFVKVNSTSRDTVISSAVLSIALGILAPLLFGIVVSQLG